MNALNFCAFAICRHIDSRPGSTHSNTSSVLIATPGLQDGHINLTTLPDNVRVATVPNPGTESTGMVMALGLYLRPDPEGKSPPTLFIAAGYESGHVGIWRRGRPPPPAAPVSPTGDSSSGSSTTTTATTATTSWQLVYLHKSHTQPVLSLCIAAAPHDSLYTSSADALLARHAFPIDAGGGAGPADVRHGSASTAGKNAPAPPKLVQTRHAGQQALALRSDARIFATAGWDGRARVYAARSMRELAVLRWHREGCYALALAEVLDGGDGGGGADVEGVETAVVAGGEEEAAAAAGPDANDGAPPGALLISRAAASTAMGGSSTLAARREAVARNTHWLALGSKDGKVSLWEMY